LLISKHPLNEVTMPYTIVFDLAFSMILIFKVLGARTILGRQADTGPWTTGSTAAAT
jgi:hypothetical protein